MAVPGSAKTPKISDDIHPERFLANQKPEKLHQPIRGLSSRVAKSLFSRLLFRRRIERKEHRLKWQETLDRTLDELVLPPKPMGHSPGYLPGPHSPEPATPPQGRPGVSQRATDAVSFP